MLCKLIVRAGEVMVLKTTFINMSVSYIVAVSFLSVVHGEKPRPSASH